LDQDHIDGRLAIVGSPRPIHRRHPGWASVADRRRSQRGPVLRDRCVHASWPRLRQTLTRARWPS